MLEELLNCQEYSKSILIIDDIDNDASIFFYSIINRIIQRGTHLLQLYPCYHRTQDNFNKYFRQNVTIHGFLTNFLFNQNNNPSECFFKMILDDLDKQKELAIRNDQKKSSYLLFENTNLILRHFNNNPFKLLHFVLDVSKRLDTSAIVMLIHRDSVEATVLNQIKSTFQTVISCKESVCSSSSVNDLGSGKKSEMAIQVTHRNLKSSIVKLYDETVYLDDTFVIDKIQKHVKNLKTKVLDNKEPVEEEALFKDLTFNVHLNDSDMEAKNNLILPYEIIGQSNSVNISRQQKMASDIQEDSKIYYAPDEADDVDDDDPDDDLNF